MRLTHRTALAAFAAASLAILTIALVFRGQVNQILIDRVDDQLDHRAATAPVLAAVGPRLARSELSGTVQPTRIITGLGDGGPDGSGPDESGPEVVELGPLPDDPLPLPSGPGLTTARADGQRWRLLTISVVDVPEPGDEALVQLVAPLGNIDLAGRRLRRRAGLVGILAAVGAGAAGWSLGLVASRPITALRRDTERLSDRDPDRWRVAAGYGSPEVDQVAATLNTTLGRLATETERRGEALAAARSFAAAASHELRVPLQSTLTNLNLAADPRLPEAERTEVLVVAAGQLRRMGDALGAIRAVTEAELAEPSWFGPVDLVELIDATVTEEGRRLGTAVELRVAGSAGTGVGPEPPDRNGSGDRPVPAVWADGARLAVANLVRNAVVHGRHADRSDRPARVTVTVDPAAATVTVDDDGPGFPPGGGRERLLGRFERASDERGSGLGLAIAHQVALAHGGGIDLLDNPGGGARVVFRLASGATPPDPRR